jgi:hypothetical protein
LLKRVAKALIVLLLAIALLVVSTVLAFRLTSVQTYFAKKAAKTLSDEYNTEVKIEKLAITFSRFIRLEKVLVRDFDKDTMIYAGVLDVHYSGRQLFNRKVLIKGMSLENAYVHLQKDTSGAMNFSQVFRLGKTKKKDNAQNPFAWDVVLKELGVVNTHFDFTDKKARTTVNVDVTRSLIKMNDLGIKTGKLSVNEITMVNPIVEITVDPKPKAPNDTLKPFHFLPDGFEIEFGRLLLTNAAFKLNNVQKPLVEKGIDFNHLDISNINVNITKGALIRDSIFASIRSLSADEKCGLKLVNLRAEAKVTVNEILCNKLLLQTDESTVGNFISLKYEHFRDFKKFLEKVRLKGDLRNTKVSLRDINYFAKKLDKIQHNTIFISGNIDGRVNNMRGRDIELRTGRNTYFKGNFSTFGLPQVYETSLNLRVSKAGVSLQDIAAFYPTLKLPANLSTLGNIAFSGNIDGFLTDIVANGKFKTDIGSATTNLNFKYNSNTKESAYKGELALFDFDLGKFTRNESALGTVTAHATIKGKGITLEKLDADVQGAIDHISLMKYDYKNAQVNGLVKGKTFVGKVGLQDKNIDFDFDGMMNLNTQSPEFNFVANVRHANLKELNLTKNELTVRTELSSNFNGKNIDDLAGSILLRNTRLANSDTSVFLDFIQLQGYVEGERKKSLLLKSKFLEADVSGYYTYSTLVPTIKDIIQTAFTQSNPFNVARVTSQDFSFDVRVFEPGALTQIIHPKFKLLRNSKIQGAVNSQLSQISMNGFVPEFQWGNTTLQRTKFTAGIIGRELDVNLVSDNIFQKDSLIVDTLNVLLHNEKDNMKFNVIAWDKNHINRANITSHIYPLSDGVEVKVEPSEVWLANNLWNFSNNNSILVKGNKITSSNFSFNNNEQSIALDAYLNKDSSTSIKTTFNQIALSDFTRAFLPKNSGISATVNGYATVENVFAIPSVIADVKLSDVIMGEIPIGDMSVQSELDNAQNRVLINSVISGKGNDVRAYGFYSLDNAKPDLNMSIDLRKLGLEFLNYPFFKTYVRDVVGNASGKLRLQGILSKLALTGNLRIDTAAVTVSYLNTRYGLKKQDVTVTENNINLNFLTVNDLNTNDKNSAVASGRIYHTYFKKFGIECKVNTQNMMVLNTTAEQNPVFYGKAFADGNVTFRGPFNDMTIRATVRTMPGTYVNLPIRSTKETNRYSFFQFVDKSADTLAVAKKPRLKLNGLTFILEADVTPDAAIDIVLDPVAGDILTSVGRGNIKLEIAKTGGVSMYGTYEVARGDYLFTLQNIVNKRFKLDPGSTINFTGDIYQAGLNMDAVYDVRTSTYDLISDFFERTGTGDIAQSEAETRARTSIPAKLLLKLTGVLAAPNVAFDIRVQDPDPTIRTMVDNRLQIIRTNETEMYKQVFGLLMLNRFLPPGNTINNSVAGVDIGGGLANTVGEFLSSQLSRYLNNLVSNFVSDFDINFRFRQYSQQGVGGGQTAEQTADTRRELQLALTKRFFNDRFSVSAGGNVDFGNTTVADNSGTGVSRVATANLAGDFQLEYKLTKDGRWRARAFNRTDYDNFNLRNRNRTGLGITYRKDFDNAKELFTVPKKKRKSKTVTLPPEPEIDEGDVPEIQPAQK